MLTQEELDSLQPGQIVDLRDNVNHWLLARVKEVFPETKVISFHYIGFHDGYDEAFLCASPNARIARAFTHVGRFGSRLANIRVNYFVEVYYQGHWCRGQVRKVCRRHNPSSQIQVAFYHHLYTRNQLRWFDRLERDQVRRMRNITIIPHLLRLLAKDDKMWPVKVSPFIKRPQIRIDKTGQILSKTAIVQLFLQIKNGWIVPMKIQTLDANAYVFKGYVTTDIRRAMEDYVSHKSITHISKTEWRGFPKFDYNCQRKLKGFLQGWLYRLVSSKTFVPEFRVKRKHEVPNSDLNLLVDMIVDFVPVWAIFRDPSKDAW